MRAMRGTILVASVVAGMVLVVTAAFGGSYASGNGETWTGTTSIDKEVALNGKDVRLAEGARLLFRGDGRLHIVGGSFSAESATIEAESVLTNAFRVRVDNGRISIVKCKIRGLQCREPVKGEPWYIGAICSDNGHGSLFAGNDVYDSSAVAYWNSSDVRIFGNVFIRSDIGVHLLRPVGCRVSRNAFFHARQSALKLGFAEATDVVENRFAGCKTGIEVVRGQGSRFLGNSLFDGEIGILVSYDEKASVYSGTLFEGLREAAFKSATPLSDGTVIANSIFSNCTRRFVLADQPEGCKVSVFGTIEKGTM